MQVTGEAILSNNVSLSSQHSLSKGFTYLLVDSWVVEHGNELFEEGLLGDLLVEGHACAVHQDVKQAQ